MIKFFGELLSELAALVSEFLCPREYHEALQELGRHDWPELKRSLSGPDAAHILTLLQAFLEAHHADNRAKQDYIHGITDHEPWTEAYEIRRQTYHELLKRL